MDKLTPDQVRELGHRVKAWADGPPIDNTDELRLALGNTYVAAHAVVAIVDRLLSGLEPSDELDQLTELNIWLYDELSDHLTDLEWPMRRAVDALGANG